MSLEVNLGLYVREVVEERKYPLIVDKLIVPAGGCLLHHITMKTLRRLQWDPVAERLIGDDAANAMLSRPQRPRYAV